MKIKFLVLTFIFATTTFAQSKQEIQQIFHESLNFLEKTQCDSTIEGKQYAGEWTVWMNLTEPFFFIGKKQKARDSNCFTVSAIHNFLSEIYLKDTTLIQLKPVLQKAFQEIQSYSTNKKYNFWKLLPPKTQLGFSNKEWVRRPTNYQLKFRFLRNMCNVPEDADDTSLANLAVFYHNQIFNDSLKILSYHDFDAFLDKKRRNRNWYNFMIRTPKNSGAYLTWFDEEKDVLFWNPVGALVSLVTIFTPISSGFPTPSEKYIPFGANDLDVIVNANVLSYLADNQQIEQSKGKKGAIKIIEKVVEKERWHLAGIYYPNAYHFHYAVSRAYQKGVNELKKSAEKLAIHLAKTQNKDGSFESKSWLNQKDKIQSTAYALHAMLDLKQKGIEIPKEKIEKSVNFLISQVKKDENQAFWEGGVYFSGGTVVRNILVWQSDAYTTALIAKCLQRFLELE